MKRKLKSTIVVKPCAVIVHNMTPKVVKIEILQRIGGVASWIGSRIVRFYFQLVMAIQVGESGSCRVEVGI